MCNESAFSERSEILGVASSPSVKRPYICVENMLRVSSVKDNDRSFRKEFQKTVFSC